RQAGDLPRQVGLVLEQRAVLRSGQKVMIDDREGVITSGSFSPTLGCSIALARVPRNTGDSARVDIRGNGLDVQVIRPGFVRSGRQRFDTSGERIRQVERTSPSMHRGHRRGATPPANGATRAATSGGAGE